MEEIKHPEVQLKEHFFACRIFDFHLDPVAKPRMTRSDKWKKRKATGRYWEFKDEIKKQANEHGFKMPVCGYYMIFFIPMPNSWSKKKRVQMDLTPHQVKPDKDNLEKAVLDALCESDAHIWDGRVMKVWAEKGKIRVIVEL